MDEYEVAACDLSRKVRVPFAHPAHHPDREQWAETERVDLNAEVDRMVPTRDPVTQCGVLCCRMGQPVSEGYLRRKKDWRNYYAGELDELFQPDGVGVTYCGGGSLLVGQWEGGEAIGLLASVDQGGKEDKLGTGRYLGDPRRPGQPLQGEDGFAVIDEVTFNATDRHILMMALEQAATAKEQANLPRVTAEIRYSATMKVLCGKK